MSAWSLIFEGYEPRQEGLRETLCALGNGYFVTRGAAPDTSADDVHYPGTCLAGGYNRLTTQIDGVAVENEDLVNLPNWLPLGLRIDGGDWLGPDAVTYLDYRQELDLRQGILMRPFRWSRALLRYRDRRLAEQEGFRGAMFPWQSGSNGREESQKIHLNPMSGRWIPDNSHRQRHIAGATAKMTPAGIARRRISWPKRRIRSDDRELRDDPLAFRLESFRRRRCRRQECLARRNDRQAA